jgi:hypothetical protein
MYNIDRVIQARRNEIFKTSYTESISASSAQECSSLSSFVFTGVLTGIFTGVFIVQSQEHSKG